MTLASLYSALLHLLISIKARGQLSHRLKQMTSRSRVYGTIQAACISRLLHTEVGGQGGGGGRRHWRLTMCKTGGNAGFLANKHRKSRGVGEVVGRGRGAGWKWQIRERGHWTRTNTVCIPDNKWLRPVVWQHVSDWGMWSAFGITALYKCSPFTVWRRKLQPSLSRTGPCGADPSVYWLSQLVCAGAAALAHEHFFPQQDM